MVCDIESVSDDLKTRIDALGYQDKWVALKLVGAAATAATGVGGGAELKYWLQLVLRSHNKFIRIRIPIKDP